MENYEENLRKFVIELFNVDAIKFGEYKTKIGILTPIYCDLRVIVSYPRLLTTLSDLIIEKIKPLQVDIICGVPYTALPIATVVSVKADIPMVMRRKETKDYGTKKLIEGTFEKGNRCLVIEDVVTSGSSILETVSDLRNAGIEVSEAVVLLNREQGGEKFLKDKRISMIALLSLSQLVQILKEDGLIDNETYEKVLKYIRENRVQKNDLIKPTVNRLKLSYAERSTFSKNPITVELFNLMEQKHTNLCVAADLTNTTDILNLAESIGPYICLLKLHVDIIEDFHENFIKRLQEISTAHNFLLFEDRKFADIGKTVQLQYSKGTYLISSWAHLVTAHTIMGKGILDAIKQCEGLKKRGIFLLAESSTDGLITPDYTKATINMAKNHQDLVTGFVCQSPQFLEEPQYIQLTPGVQISTSVDDLDQKYNSPEAVIIDKGADIAVVGRGIVKAEDVEKTAVKYRDLLWEAYKKRILRN